MSLLRSVRRDWTKDPNDAILRPRAISPVQHSHIMVVPLVSGMSEKPTIWAALAGSAILKSRLGGATKAEERTY